MPTYRFPQTPDARVDVRWRTPGGAGGVRTAFVTLRATAAATGRVTLYGFSVAIADDGNGREDALRRQAYRLILPAMNRLALRLGRDPAAVAQVERDPAGRKGEVRFSVASDDMARRAYCDVSVRLSGAATDEDLIATAGGVAFPLIDGLAKDLQTLAGPDD